MEGRVGGVVDWAEAKRLADKIIAAPNGLEKRKKDECRPDLAEELAREARLAFIENIESFLRFILCC